VDSSHACGFTLDLYNNITITSTLANETFRSGKIIVEDLMISRIVSQSGFEKDGVDGLLGLGP